VITRACFAAALVFFASLSSAAAQNATEEARRHFDIGTQAFDTGDYDRAVAEFQASYELTHHPDLLFNIYSAAERAGHREPAADALERFLAEGAVEPDRRPALEQRLARLRERIAQDAQTEPVDAPDVAPEPGPQREGAPTNTLEAHPEPEPASPSGPHPAAIGTLIAAGVLAASFGVFAGLSEAEDGSLSSTCGRSCTDAQVSTLRAYDIVADVSWITAAAAGVTGLVLLFVLPPDGASSNDVALAPWAAPGSAGVVATGKF
jgi:hypothetical protein